MHFRVIDGEVPGALHQPIVRGLSLLVAFLVVLPPGLLLVSFGVFVLISLVDSTVSQAASDMSVGDRLFAVAVMAILTVPLLLLARRFILGHRRLVLFLRKFGEVGGLQFVTTAATAPGPLFLGLRLVTLDDRSSYVPSFVAGGRAGRRPLEVADQQDLESALRKVDRMSRRLLGPATLFLRVADPMWPEVVLRLARETDLVLADVSHPGRNLLWELETIRPLVRSRWVLVGEATALHRMATSPVPLEPQTDEQRLIHLLRGEEVLAYHLGHTTNRFRRALLERYGRVTRLGHLGTQGHLVGSGTTQAPVPPTSPVPPALRRGPGQYRDLPPSGPGSLASIAERVGARLIDGGLYCLALLGLFAAQTALSSLWNADMVTFVISSIVLVVTFGYDSLTTRLLGSTPGKRSLSLRVVTEDGLRPASIHKVGLRFVTQLLLWFPFLLPGILDLSAAIADPGRRAWHDRLAGTLVVRDQPRTPKDPFGSAPGA